MSWEACVSYIDVHTTLLQADWRACLDAWTERERGSQASWTSKLWWGVRRLQQPKTPHDLGLFLGPAILHFDSAGISMRQGVLHVVYEWLDVSEGTATPEHLFLWLEQGSLIVVPIRSLPPSTTVVDFRSRLESLHDAALRRPPAVLRSALHDGPVPAEARVVTADF
jgi:hypothetical protein